MIDAALASGVIAVVRLPAAADFRALAGALVAGGVSVVEITLTTPGALAAIADLTAPNAVPGAVVGAGTVLDERSARAVIAAGARRGIARRRVAHQALPRVAGRAPLHPRSARPAAVSPPGAVRWRVARQRGRLDPRRRDRGQPRQRPGEPVARDGAGLGPADGARPRADRPRRGGPPTARRGTGVS